MVTNFRLARQRDISEDAFAQLQNTLESRIQIATRFLMERIALDAAKINEAERMKVHRVTHHPYCFK